MPWSLPTRTICPTLQARIGYPTDATLTAKTAHLCLKWFHWIDLFLARLRYLCQEISHFEVQGVGCASKLEGRVQKIYLEQQPIDLCIIQV